MLQPIKPRAGINTTRCQTSGENQNPASASASCELLQLLLALLPQLVAVALADGESDCLALLPQLAVALAEGESERLHLDKYETCGTPTRHARCRRALTCRQHSSILF